MVLYYTEYRDSSAPGNALLLPCEELFILTGLVSTWRAPRTGTLFDPWALRLAYAASFRLAHHFTSGDRSEKNTRNSTHPRDRVPGRLSNPQFIKRVHTSSLNLLS